MKRFRCKDDLGNVAYIYNDNGWRCALHNGMPASMFYAVGNCDEMALRFALEDADSDDQRLAIIKEAAGVRRTVEMI